MLRQNVDAAHTEGEIAVRAAKLNQGARSIHAKIGGFGWIWTDMGIEPP